MKEKKKPVKKLKKKASEVALDYIKEKILSQEWKSGDKISPEPVLEEAIGVSRSSIRSAVEKLVAINLLVKKPGNGTYVNEVNIESVLETFLPLIVLNHSTYYDIIQCRKQLDFLAIELVIPFIDNDFLSKLNNLHSKMMGSINNVEHFIELDIEFHKVIVKQTRNETLYLIYSILFSVLKNFSKSEYSKIPLEKKCKHHKDLLRALSRRDKDLAIAYDKVNFIEVLDYLNEHSL